MSKVLKVLFMVTVVIFELTPSISALGQCVVKTTVKNGIKTLQVPEYYTYNRTADSYDGLSLKLSFITSPGSKQICKLNLIFTSSVHKLAAKITFQPADSTKQVNLILINDGIKSIDNKKLYSNLYHTVVNDNQMLQLSQNPSTKLAILDYIGQTIAAYTVIEPDFLQQQLNCLQNPPKPVPTLLKKHTNR